MTPTEPKTHSPKFRLPPYSIHQVCIVSQAWYFRFADVRIFGACAAVDNELNAQDFMQINDRTKDVIKSGGEWISSIDIENAAVSHDAIAEAGAIGRYHPKWTERLLLVVVLRPGASATCGKIIAFLKDQLHKMSVPDDVVFVEELPHTATGKVNKLALRKLLEDYQCPITQLINIF